MLDINLYRADKGGNAVIIRESLRRRCANFAIVDEIIALDLEWRRRQILLEDARKQSNILSKEVAPLKIAEKSAIEKTGETEETKELIAKIKADIEEKIKQTAETKVLIAKREKDVDEVYYRLKEKLLVVGNLVHDSVPDEANNAVIRTWGEKRIEPKLKNHVELVELLGIADLEKGADVSGGSGFYLNGDGALLNQALINYGLAFLMQRGYTPLQTPSFMRMDIMKRCAQLAQFDEELCKVTGEGDDKYLISTVEQSLCAYHLDDWIYPSELPIRYAGYSSCFRKEAGTHGRDTLGIFGVNQLDEVVQFCITSPNGNESWDMHEEMIKTSEDFYQTLKLPHRIVAIVSGALNNAAAKTYTLEAWFPASQTYRELVSCSNYTDYRSRRLGIRFGQKKNEQTKQYVHLLNSTLTATERTMCCILENYQREDGVEVPEVLRPYMGGIAFLPFLPKAEKSNP